jgi:hypothetical protein
MQVFCSFCVSIFCQGYANFGGCWSIIEGNAKRRRGGYIQKENNMKFKILSMLVTLGILSVVPMIYMGKFDPLAFFGSGLDSGLSDLEKLKAKAPEGFSNAVTDEKVQVYKWRDEHGVMQFSNTPPASGAAAEQIVLKPNSNIVQAVKIPVKESAAEEVSSSAPNPYSIKGMKKVMDDAKGVEQLLQNRHEQQQKMLNDI